MCWVKTWILGGGKKKVMGVNIVEVHYNVSYIYFTWNICIHMKIAYIWNPLKTVEAVTAGKLRKHNRGGEFDQSTFYECMEISQWTPCIINLC
jgi:hypothetical protein